MPEDVIKGIVDGNISLAQAAAEAGIESKAKDGNEPEAEANGEANEVDISAAMKSLVSDVAEVLRPYLETVKQVEARLIALEKRLDDSGEEGEQDEGVDSEDSGAQVTFAKALREALASTSPATSVDGRSSLAKSKPEETEPEKKTVTGFPWLDEIISKE